MSYCCSSLLCLICRSIASGHLIGSAVPTVIEAVVDHVYCHMDDNLDDFRGLDEFQALVSMAQFSNILNGNAIVAEEVGSAIDAIAEDISEA